MPDEANARVGLRKMLSARELADFLGVHQNYVYDQAVNGDLPSYKFGGVRRFRLREVEEWLAKHRSASMRTAVVLVVIVGALLLVLQANASQRERVRAKRPMSYKIDPAHPGAKHPRPLRKDRWHF